jgi:periplasmic protein TonB
VSKGVAGVLDLSAASGPPARRRSDRRRATPADRDRLLTMLVMATLLHGLLILGIRFQEGASERSEGIGMEVLLVSDELPESQENPDARYLAQRTQQGSGNVTERVAARLPGAPPEPVPDPGTQAPATEGATAEEAALHSANGRFHTQFRAEAFTAPATAAASDGGPQAPVQREPDSELALRGPRRDELYISPDTRNSELAPYLSSWKRRVEQVGTVNYPSAAQRRGLTGSPVIEVVLFSDGRLRTATIKQTSGHAEIDAAALEILKLASPFEPFPTELAARHDSLRFAYEWQFSGGRMKGAASVP